MARTFRIRHYPVLPGTAKRFAFTYSEAWRRKDQLILDLARKLAPDVQIGANKFRFGRIAYWQQSSDARSLVDTLEQQVVVPLLSPYQHPWVGGYCGLNIRAAKFVLQKAHRAMRRQTKYLLNKSGRDYDEVLMPEWYEYFDSWNLS